MFWVTISFEWFLPIFIFTFLNFQVIFYSTKIQKIEGIMLVTSTLAVCTWELLSLIVIQTFMAWIKRAELWWFCVLNIIVRFFWWFWMKVSYFPYKYPRGKKLFNIISSSPHFSPMLQVFCFVFWSNPNFLIFPSKIQ